MNGLMSWMEKYILPVATKNRVGETLGCIERCFYWYDASYDGRSNCCFTERIYAGFSEYVSR